MPDGGASLSDGEVAAVRDQLYALGRALGPLWGEGAREDALTLVSDSERTDVEERAAILEFDAGLPRPLAERFALADRKRG